MFKKTFSSLSVLSLFSLGIVTPINAADLPAVWLKVTADGVPGSAPSLNRIKAKGKNPIISKNKCKKNTGKTFGAIAGGIFGASKGKSNKSKIAGAASGALTDIGINDQFLRELAETLPKGSAALALLVRDGTPDRVIERLRSHAPNARLVKTNLSHTDEDKLRELLKGAAQQAEALRLS